MLVRVSEKKKVIEALSTSDTNQSVKPEQVNDLQNEVFSTEQNTESSKELSEDLQAVNFPGEDPIASQLDLARAYIDMGKLKLARKILESILSDEKTDASLRNLATILLSECAIRETKE
jgi:FimV-like protein